MVDVWLMCGCCVAYAWLMSGWFALDAMMSVFDILGDVWLMRVFLVRGWCAVDTSKICG